MAQRRFADRDAADLIWDPPAPTSPADLHRLAIDACLSEPLSDSEWNLLETQGFVADLRQRRRSPEQAAALVDQWRDAVRGPVRRLRNPGASVSQRASAMAYLLAVEARNLPSVLAFRRKVLKNKLLRPEQVEHWFSILTRNQESKPWAKLYVSAEEAEVGVVQIGKANLVEQGYDVLEFLVPNSEQVRRVLVSSKGALGYLHWLTQQLSRHYRWQACQATMFVLTDAVPQVLESTFEIDDRRAVPALSRVVITVDPTMNPREVADMYRQIRLKHFGRRHRSMTPKHVELAKFWAEQEGDCSWKELQERWNQLHPEWSYQREQNFARDCAQARKRLLA